MTAEAYATLAILIGLFGLLIKTELPPAADSASLIDKRNFGNVVSYEVSVYSMASY